MARNDRKFIATYPDGESNLEVRIGLNAGQYHNAMRSHGNARAIEGARSGICTQVKKAIMKRYGSAPRWIEWEHLTLKEVAVPQPPPPPPTLF